MDAATIRVRDKATGNYLAVLPAPPIMDELSTVMPITTAYHASSQTTRVSRWRPATVGPNTSISEGIETRRARSRDAVRNEGVAEGAIETLATAVVGTGIVPQFNTLDTDFNEELAEAFLEWTDEADADQRLDFYGMQALAFRSMCEGGDVFARHRMRRAEDGLSVPYQVQLLEAEMCPDSKNENAAPGGQQIRMGIEFNLIGQRVAYHMFPAHPFDWGVQAAALAVGSTVAIPASEIAHMAVIRRPGEIRGDPWLTRSLLKIWNLGIYDDAQLTRQQIAALFAGFISKDDPVPAGDEEAIFAGQTEPDTAGIAVAPLEPGTMQGLQPGEKITWSTPPTPGDSYEAFVRAQQRMLGVSAGVLYEQISGDYSQGNDRTWRAAVNEFRRRMQRLQHQTVVFQLCRPILARWAMMGTISRRWRLPDGVTPAQIARAKWIPQRWEYINPPQDIKADRDEIRAGLVSRSEKISQRGYAPQQIEQEIIDENERADDEGLIFDSDARRTTEGGASQAKAAGFSFPDPRVKAPEVTPPPAEE